MPAIRRTPRPRHSAPGSFNSNANANPAPPHNHNQRLTRSSQQKRNTNINNVPDDNNNSDSDIQSISSSPPKNTRSSASAAAERSSSRRKSGSAIMTSTPSARQRPSRFSKSLTLSNIPSEAERVGRVSRFNTTTTTPSGSGSGSRSLRSKSKARSVPTRREKSHPVLVSDDDDGQDEQEDKEGEEGEVSLSTEEDERDRRRKARAKARSFPGSTSGTRSQSRSLRGKGRREGDRNENGGSNADEEEDQEEEEEEEEAPNQTKDDEEEENDPRAQRAKVRSARLREIELERKRSRGPYALLARRRRRKGNGDVENSDNRRGSRRVRSSSGGGDDGDEDTSEQEEKDDDQSTVTKSNSRSLRSTRSQNKNRISTYPRKGLRKRKGDVEKGKGKGKAKEVQTTEDDSMDFEDDEEEDGNKTGGKQKVSQPQSHSSSSSTSRSNSISVLCKEPSSFNATTTADTSSSTSITATPPATSSSSRRSSPRIAVPSKFTSSSSSATASSSASSASTSRIGMSMKSKSLSDLRTAFQKGLMEKKFEELEWIGRNGRKRKRGSGRMLDGPNDSDSDGDGGGDNSNDGSREGNETKKGRKLRRMDGSQSERYEHGGDENDDDMETDESIKVERTRVSGSKQVGRQEAEEMDEDEDGGEIEGWMEEDAEDDEEAGENLTLVRNRSLRRRSSAKEINYSIADRVSQIFAPAALNATSETPQKNNNKKNARRTIEKKILGGSKSAPSSPQTQMISGWNRTSLKTPGMSKSRYTSVKNTEEEEDFFPRRNSLDSTQTHFSIYSPHPSGSLTAAETHQFPEEEEDLDDGELYVRSLRNFVVFDAANDNRMVGLNAISHQREGDTSMRLCVEGIARAVDLEDPDTDVINANLKRKEKETEAAFLKGQHHPPQEEDPLESTHRRLPWSSSPHLSLDGSEVHLSITDLENWQPEVIRHSGSVHIVGVDLWLETRSAWYRLVGPSKEYEPIFEQYTRYAHLFMQAKMAWSVGAGVEFGNDMDKGRDVVVKEEDLDKARKDMSFSKFANLVEDDRLAMDQVVSWPSYRLLRPLDKEDVKKWPVELDADLEDQLDGYVALFGQEDEDSAFEDDGSEGDWESDNGVGGESSTEDLGSGSDGEELETERSSGDGKARSKKDNRKMKIKSKKHTSKVKEEKTVKKIGKIANIDEEVLRHRVPTQTTPIIYKLGGLVHWTALQCTSSKPILEPLDEDDDDDDVEPISKPAHLRGKLVKGRKDATVAFRGNIVYVSKDKRKERSYYREARINLDKKKNLEVTVGDMVQVQGESKNRDLETWFCKIISIWKDEKDEAMFHARWFIPATETALGETAFSQELVAVDQCDDVSLESIVECTNAKYIESKGAHPTSSNDSPDFFYCYQWDQPDASFTDFNPRDDPKLNPTPRGEEPKCATCLRRPSEKPEWVHGPVIESRHLNLPKPDLAFISDGVEYHLADYVYVPNDTPNEPYIIGQIERVNGQDRSVINLEDEDERPQRTPETVTLRILLRYGELFSEKDAIPRQGQMLVDDERELVLTDARVETDIQNIDGVCNVVHGDKIKSLLEFRKVPDAFWFSHRLSLPSLKGEYDHSELMSHLKPGRSAKLSKKNFKAVGMRDWKKCARCTKLWKLQFSDLTQYIRVNADLEEEEIRKKEHAEPVHGEYRYSRPRDPDRPDRGEGTYLRSLDIFAGSGGFSRGLEQTGATKALWAIEFSPSASETYRINNPHTSVFNQDANVVLRECIRNAPRPGYQPDDDAVENGPVRDLLGRPMPPLPKPGEVDIIHCGPPCQGFSRINHQPKANDLRCSLVALALSYVEYFMPTYFILENVSGLIEYRLGAKMKGRKQVGGIEQGVVKFIVRALTILGYQVRFGLLHAGCYGTPQSRKRIIFLASKRGISLPKFPQPSHTFPRSGGMKIRLPNGERARVSKRYEGSAPHKFITCKQATSDLPEWEYKNPEKVIKLSASDRAARDHIPQYSTGLIGMPIGPMSVRHRKMPENHYQEAMREKLGCSQGSNEQGGGARKPDMLKKTTAHVTRAMSKDYPVEQICNIPFKGGKKDRPNFRLLPAPLAFSKRKASRSPNCILQRLNQSRPFDIILASGLNPFSRGASSLHPTLNRIVSIREAARAQGYPDSFEFLSLRTIEFNNDLETDNGRRKSDGTKELRNGFRWRLKWGGGEWKPMETEEDIEDMRNAAKVNSRGCTTDWLRMIGNSVPLPLAAALGHQFRNILVGELSQRLEREKEEEGLGRSADRAMKIEDNEDEPRLNKRRVVGGR